jgi:putative PIN family toxin of toxin-antitoxin system
VSRFFIIDTNVVVAGLLASQTDSPTARVLDGMLGAAFAFVLSETLLAEYRAVLARPHLSRLHGLSEAQVDTVLADLAQHAIVLNAPAQQALRAPDPGDQFLWDLLLTRSDLVLVTGDKRLLESPDMAHKVITPGVFVATEWGH